MAERGSGSAATKVIANRQVAPVVQRPGSVPVRPASAATTTRSPTRAGTGQRTAPGLTWDGRCTGARRCENGKFLRQSRRAAFRAAHPFPARRTQELLKFMSALLANKLVQWHGNGILPQTAAKVHRGGQPKLPEQRSGCCDSAAYLSVMLPSAARGAARGSSAQWWRAD